MSSTVAYAEAVPAKHRGPCGKVCYGSYTAARRAIRGLQRYQKARTTQGYLEPYGCKQCRALHVGHTEYRESCDE